MKREVELQTDDAGQLTGVQYHDGYMTKFCLGDQLLFEVRAVDNSLTELVISGIKTLCTDPLWESTIVTDVDVWKAADAPHSYWRNLLRGRESLKGLEEDLKWYLPEFADFWLVEVGTAYGGGFTCLCERVQVFQTPAIN